MDYPAHLDIELSNACQLSCVMCPRGIGKMNRPLGNMDPALVEKISKESMGRVNIIWGHLFGEPLLYPALPWALKILKSTKAWVGISTNAVALDRQAARAIFYTNIDCLILSLDSLNKERYESIRRGAIFEDVLDNIENCIRIRRTMPKCRTWLLVQIIDFENSIDEVEAAKSRFDKSLFGIGEVFHKWHSTYGGKVPRCSGKVISPSFGICEYLDRGMAIYWNGDAALCCHDVAGEYMFGNVKELGIAGVWNSEKRIRLHEKIKIGDLDGLEMCRICMGKY